MYSYSVSCWVNPKSDFELAQRNKELKVILKKYPVIYNSITCEKKGDGMILKNFKFEFPVEVNVSKVIMPLIRKDYPEAKLINHDISEGTPLSITSS